MKYRLLGKGVVSCVVGCIMECRTDKHSMAFSSLYSSTVHHGQVCPLTNNHELILDVSRKEGHGQRSQVVVNRCASEIAAVRCSIYCVTVLPCLSDSVICILFFPCTVGRVQRVSKSPSPKARMPRNDAVNQHVSTQKELRTTQSIQQEWRYSGEKNAESK